MNIVQHWIQMLLVYPVFKSRTVECRKMFISIVCLTVSSLVQVMQVIRCTLTIFSAAEISNVSFVVLMPQLWEIVIFRSFFTNWMSLCTTSSTIIFVFWFLFHFCVFMSVFHFCNCVSSLLRFCFILFQFFYFRFY